MNLLKVCFQYTTKKKEIILMQQRKTKRHR